ncbi:MAG TPA: Rho termination factor N-terminal domain-containing protein, partial [Gemmata sp.]|nr:Rho termination factor N-terminal domain-containing protein [Gemmata sp.]
PEGEDAKPKKGAKPVKAAAADTAKLTDADGGDADDLDGMTAAELHDVARDEEVDGHSGLNKADLLAAIRKGRKSKK